MAGDIIQLEIECLFTAVAFGSPEKCRELLNSLKDVNLRNSDGETLLNVAIRAGNIEWVKKLLEMGANLGIMNKEHMTGLQVAELMKTKFENDDNRKAISEIVGLITQRETAKHSNAQESKEYSNGRINRGTTTETCSYFDGLESIFHSLIEELNSLKTCIGNTHEKIKTLSSIVDFTKESMKKSNRRLSGDTKNVDSDITWTDGRKSINEEAVKKELNEDAWSENSMKCLLPDNTPEVEDCNANKVLEVESVQQPIKDNCEETASKELTVGLRTASKGDRAETASVANTGLIAADQFDGALTSDLKTVIAKSDVFEIDTPKSNVEWPFKCQPMKETELAVLSHNNELKDSEEDIVDLKQGSMIDVLKQCHGNISQCEPERIAFQKVQRGDTKFKEIYPAMAESMSDSKEKPRHESQNRIVGKDKVNVAESLSSLEEGHWRGCGGTLNPDSNIANLPVECLGEELTIRYDDHVKDDAECEPEKNAYEMDVASEFGKADSFQGSNDKLVEDKPTISSRRVEWMSLAHSNLRAISEELTGCNRPGDSGSLVAADSDKYVDEELSIPCDDNMKEIDECHPERTTMSPGIQYNPKTRIEREENENFKRLIPRSNLKKWRYSRRPLNPDSQLHSVKGLIKKFCINNDNVKKHSEENILARDKTPEIDKTDMPSGNFRKHLEDEPIVNCGENERMSRNSSHSNRKATAETLAGLRITAGSGSEVAVDSNKCVVGLTEECDRHVKEDAKCELKRNEVKIDQAPGILEANLVGDSHEKHLEDKPTISSDTNERINLAHLNLRHERLRDPGLKVAIDSEECLDEELTFSCDANTKEDAKWVPKRNAVKADTAVEVNNIDLVSGKNEKHLEDEPAVNRGENESMTLVHSNLRATAEEWTGYKRPRDSGSNVPCNSARDSGSNVSCDSDKCVGQGFTEECDGHVKENCNCETKRNVVEIDQATEVIKANLVGDLDTATCVDRIDFDSGDNEKHLDDESAVSSCGNKRMNWAHSKLRATAEEWTGYMRLGDPEIKVAVDSDVCHNKQLTIPCDTNMKEVAECVPRKNAVRLDATMEAKNIDFFPGNYERHHESAVSSGRNETINSAQSYIQTSAEEWMGHMRPAYPESNVLVDSIMKLNKDLAIPYGAHVEELGECHSERTAILTSQSTGLKHVSNCDLVSESIGQHLDRMSITQIPKEEKVYLPPIFPNLKAEPCIGSSSNFMPEAEVKNNLDRYVGKTSTKEYDEPMNTDSKIYCVERKAAQKDMIADQGRCKNNCLESYSSFSKTVDPVDLNVCCKVDSICSTSTDLAADESIGLMVPDTGLTAQNDIKPPTGLFFSHIFPKVMNIVKSPFGTMLGIQTKMSKSVNSINDPNEVSESMNESKEVLCEDSAFQYEQTTPTDLENHKAEGTNAAVKESVKDDNEKKSKAEGVASVKRQPLGGPKEISASLANGTGGTSEGFALALQDSSSRGETVDQIKDSKCSDHNYVKESAKDVNEEKSKAEGVVSVKRQPLGGPKEISASLANSMKQIVDAMMAKTVIVGKNETKISLARSFYEKLYSRSSITSTLLNFLRFQPAVKIYIDLESENIKQMERKLSVQGVAVKNCSGERIFTDLNTKRIYLGAHVGKYHNVEHVIGFFANSLCLMSVHLAFNNRGKPYVKEDLEAQAQFIKIIAHAKASRKQGKKMMKCIKFALDQRTSIDRERAIVGVLSQIIYIYGLEESTAILNQQLESALPFLENQVISTLSRECEIQMLALTHNKV